MSKNYLKGTIGAILGAIIFSIPWILIYVYANYILSLLAAIIAYGALLFYKKFGGVITKKTSLIIIISSLLSITLATFIIIPMCLIIKEGNSFDLEYYKLLFETKEFTTALMHDYIISVIFTFLGISGVIANINKEAYSSKEDSETDDITTKPYEEQVKYLEEIYGKYDAFSKEKAIPASILLGELKMGNKLNFIKNMERKGIIVSPFVKSYFDREAVENTEKAKSNRRKNIYLPTLTGLFIGILIVALIIIPLEMNDSKENNPSQSEVKNKEYTYKNITISLPETFREDEETDNYKSYLNYSSTDPVYQVMLEQIDFEDNNQELRKEYQENYLNYLKKSFDIKSTDSVITNSLEGFKMKMFSLEYPEEYYYSFVLFDDDNIYIIMYYTSVKDLKDTEASHLESFTKQAEIYQETIKFTKNKIQES